MQQQSGRGIATACGSAAGRLPEPPPPCSAQTLLFGVITWYTSELLADSMASVPGLRTAAAAAAAAGRQLPLLPAASGGGPPPGPPSAA